MMLLRGNLTRDSKLFFLLYNHGYVKINLQAYPPESKQLAALRTASGFCIINSDTSMCSSCAALVQLLCMQLLSVRESEAVNEW